jgi:hypothetical protein
MTHDRQLIDTIKAHFARKTSTQLREIVEDGNPERWSPEAVAAADEVLVDRMAGRAEEPLTPEEERPPPPSPNPLSLALIAGLAPVGGLFLHGAAQALINSGPYRRESVRPNADLPVPFGPKLAWLALDTTDTQAAATALGLQGVRPATWAHGMDAAHQSPVFVTPPLADWTLAVGRALFPPDRAEAFVKPLLERLSRQFGDAQYFCTHRDVELHVWARARQGRLVRGYGWLGERGVTLWDEGALTKEERELGFRFNDGLDEASVMHLADLWSIDPTSLNEQYKEPVMGLVGSLAGTDLN